MQKFALILNDPGFPSLLFKTFENLPVGFVENFDSAALKSIPLNKSHLLGAFR